MKKKLLVILGAGSSVEQGLPSVATLNEEVKTWAREHAENCGVPNYYALLWENRENYCSGLPDEKTAFQKYRTAPNFERVLGDLHVLMNGVLCTPYGDPLLHWISEADVLKKMKQKRDANRGNAFGFSHSRSHCEDWLFFDVRHQLQSLLVHLAERFRGACEVFQHELCYGINTAAFAPYKQIFSALSQEFDLGVYNLNYDTVAFNVLPDTFVGFDRQTGEFLPDTVFTPAWNFLYHLHGSVHHRIPERAPDKRSWDCGPRITWCKDLWANNGHDLADSLENGGGQHVLCTTIIAGGLKLDQLQGEPFQALYSCLPRHAHEADAILIVGYGFGDSHINSILENTIRSRARANRRPPVLVIDKQGTPTAKRVADAWTLGMSNSLLVPAKAFRECEHRAVLQWSDLPDKVNPDEFEQAVIRFPQPVAIWNGGFASAANKSAQIVKWLNGDLSAL